MMHLAIVEDCVFDQKHLITLIQKNFENHGEIADFTCYERQPLPSDMAFRHMVLGTVCNGDRDFWKLRCNPLRGNNLKKGEM